jgi:hypothetical protein
MFHIEIGHLWGQWYHLLAIFPVEQKISGDRDTISVHVCLFTSYRQIICFFEEE